jgi:sulfoxide reductase heme-binding subunit YedZ
MWYVTRSSALIAFGLITAAVVLGVLGAERFHTSERPRIHYAELHRGIALFGSLMLLMHIVTAIVDPFTHLGWLSLFDPFGRTYRPLYLAVGIVAFDVLVAVVVTSLIRQRMSLVVWKRLHLMVYAIWVAGVVHGLGTGTDSKFLVIDAYYLLNLVAVVVAVWMRVLSGDLRSRTLRLSLGATSLVIPAAMIWWAASGPMHATWSSRFVSSHPASVANTAAHSDSSHGRTKPGAGVQSNGDGGGAGDSGRDE